MQTTNQSNDYYNKHLLDLKDELAGHPHELELINLCLQQIVEDNDLVIS